MGGHDGSWPELLKLEELLKIISIFHF